MKSLDGKITYSFFSVQQMIIFHLCNDRHLDEGFLTWNGSKRHLRSLLKMTTLQHHHHPYMHMNVSIGSSVHFDDAYLSHNQGTLHTKIYHYSNVNPNGLFNIPHHQICPDEKSVRKEMIRTARCCSHVHDFNSELNHIKSPYIAQGLSTKDVEKYIQQFLIEFNMSSMFLPITNPNGYKSFRLRVIEYQQQKIALKKQKKFEEKNTFIFHCPAEWNSIDVLRMKQKLDDIYKEHCQHYSEWKQMKIKLVPCRSSPLSSHDYLVDKRPPLRLLTLSEADRESDGK